MNAGWGILANPKAAKSSKTMRRKQQRNEMNFDDVDPDAYFNNAPSPHDGQNHAQSVQDGDSIRQNNKMALQQQRFVKKSQVNTGLLPHRRRRFRSRCCRRRLPLSRSAGGAPMREEEKPSCWRWQQAPLRGGAVRSMGAAEEEEEEGCSRCAFTCTN